MAQISASQNYNDFAGLASIKTLANKDHDRGLEEVAKQVEAVFFQMLIKSMHQANQVLKSDLFDSDQSDMYNDMYSQQLGLNLGQSKSLGIADMIKQQLQHNNKKPNPQEAA